MVKPPEMLFAAVALCSVTVFPRFGNYVPTPQLHGPGLLLDGAGASGSPDNTLTWLHRRLVGDTPDRGGNVVVLRASYTNIDDRHFYRAGNFASVQTVLIPPCATRKQYDAIVPIIDKADAVYFAGGDQANYVPWKGSALIEAVKRVYARGGVVGGGSAGLAIQGAVIYDSVAADRVNADTHTADAVKDPLEPRISFTTDFFAWPALANTITDTHLVARDRLGRTIVFLARIYHDGVMANNGVMASSGVMVSLSNHDAGENPEIYALGIDEGSAVVVDPDGTATVINAPKAHGAYLVRTDTPPRLTPGTPIHYTVEVSHIARDGERFDLLHKTTSDPWYTITVDGTNKAIYSENPY